MRLLFPVSFAQHGVFRAWSYCRVFQHGLPFYSWVTFRCVASSIRLSVDIGIVSSFWWLWIVLLRVLAYRFWTPVFNSSGSPPKCGIMGSYRNSTFNLLRSCRAVFHGVAPYFSLSASWSGPVSLKAMVFPLTWQTHWGEPGAWLSMSTDVRRNPEKRANRGRQGEVKGSLMWDLM